jgi:ribosome biogenesis GTPase
LHHLTPADAAQAFVELRPLLGNCRFRDCKHISEPGCAVLDAAKRGQISQRRYGSYRRLADELSRKRQAWE